jgi:hypothetical protein
MSLNQINFSAKELADLFKSTLVDSGNSTSSIPEKISNHGFRYLGENKKKVLAVVNYPDVIYLPDPQLNFLTNLAEACKLSLGDLAILNFHTYTGSDFAGISEELKPEVVILFGVSPQEFGLPLLFPQFQVQKHNGCQFLYLPSLEESEPDKIIKSKIWVCLKKIFNL